MFRIVRNNVFGFIFLIHTTHAFCGEWEVPESETFPVRTEVREKEGIVKVDLSFANPLKRWVACDIHLVVRWQSKEVLPGRLPTVVSERAVFKLTVRSKRSKAISEDFFTADHPGFRFKDAQPQATCLAYSEEEVPEHFPDGSESPSPSEVCDPVKESCTKLCSANPQNDLECK